MATSIGVFLPLAFWQLLIAAALCLLAIWRSGYVSLGSLTLVTNPAAAAALQRGLELAAPEPVRLGSGALEAQGEYPAIAGGHGKELAEKQGRP